MSRDHPPQGMRECIIIERSRTISVNVEIIFIKAFDLIFSTLNYLH